jgi:hypothetical protein
VVAQAVINEINNARGNGEAQTFTASSLRQNESVNPENEAVHIDQRASAVAGINRSVGLQINERLGGIRLAGERADHPHGDRILQTFRTADGEDELAYAGSLLAEKGESRQIGIINFQQCEISFLVLPKEASFKNPALPDRGLATRIARRDR